MNRQDRDEGFDRNNRGGFGGPNRFPGRGGRMGMAGQQFSQRGGTGFGRGGGRGGEWKNFPLSLSSKFIISNKIN